MLENDASAAEVVLCKVIDCMAAKLAHAIKRKLAWLNRLLCMDQHGHQGAVPVIADHHAVAAIDGTTQGQLLAEIYGT